jgi:hypothetical protein
VVASVSVENLFLPNDTARFAGLAILRNVTTSGTAGYDLLLSGSYSWVYKVSLTLSKTPAIKLVDVIPLANFPSGLSQYVSIQNWNPTSQTWLVPSLPIAAQSYGSGSSTSVGALQLTGGALYVARDEENVLELYSFVTDVTVSPLKDSLQFAVQLSYPPGVLQVEGLHLNSNSKSLIVATDFPAALQKLYWNPATYFGCVSGPIRTG